MTIRWDLFLEARQCVRLGSDLCINKLLSCQFHFYEYAIMGGKIEFLSRCLLLAAQDHQRMQQERAACATCVDNRGEK